MINTWYKPEYIYYHAGTGEYTLDLPDNIKYSHCFVSVDKNGKSKEVPRLIVESVGEQAEWEAGKKRSELRKTRMKEGF